MFCAPGPVGSCPVKEEGLALFCFPNPNLCSLWQCPSGEIEAPCQHTSLFHINTFSLFLYITLVFPPCYSSPCLSSLHLNGFWGQGMHQEPFIVTEWWVSHKLRPAGLMYRLPESTHTNTGDGEKQIWWLCFSNSVTSPFQIPVHGSRNNKCEALSGSLFLCLSVFVAPYLVS